MATLEGQTVVIVGGTSGIGFGVAKSALLSRATKVIVASSSQAKIDRAVEILRSLAVSNDLPGEVLGGNIDARDLSSVRSFFEGLGEIDHLAWTAGERILPGFKDVELESRKGMFDTRFWGPAAAAQEARIKTGGSITLTLGQVMVRPMPTFSILAGGSGAIDSMTRGLAVDLAPVRVNAVSVGLVRTEFWDELPPVLIRRSEAFGEKMLLKRVGTPEELAEGYLFFMKCGYVTGQTIGIDGGAVLVPVM